MVHPYLLGHGMLKPMLGKTQPGPSLSAPSQHNMKKQVQDIIDGKFGSWQGPTPLLAKPALLHVFSYAKNNESITAEDKEIMLDSHELEIRTKSFV